MEFNIDKLIITKRRFWNEFRNSYPMLSERLNEYAVVKDFDNGELLIDGSRVKNIINSVQI